MGDQVFSVLEVLSSNVSTFLLEEGKLLGGFRQEIQLISEEFRHMKAFLEAMESNQEDDPRIQVWINQVREAAYDTEDVLDEFKFLFASQNPHGILGSLHSNLKSIKNLPARHRLATKLQSIKARIQTISEAHRRYESQYGKITEKVPGRFPANNAWRYSKDDEALYIKESQLVGIDKHKRRLLSLLLQGDSQFKVIAVLGMGGIGKTTLVKQVHDDTHVKNHFQIRAWVTVSQTYDLRDLRDLLKGLLWQLVQDFNDPAPLGMESMDAYQLKSHIRNFLQRARYTIVFDDVWGRDFWDALKYIFPENSYGGNSVMLTTRIGDVASASCNESEGDYMYRMEFLNLEDSWTLFCRRTFRDNFCPANLKIVAEEIVAKCQGLPLAIVAISGVLASKDLSRIDEWERVHRGLGDEYEGLGKLDIAKKILRLSYNDLPSGLKSCLLSTVIFLEDDQIHSFNLIQKWIAERFVEQRSGQSIEDVAWDHLKELANRSLILVDVVRYDGFPCFFHVHDLLREIIVAESREKNFMTVFGTTPQQQTGIRWPPEKVVRRLVFHYNCNPLLDYTSASQESCHYFGNLRTLITIKCKEPPPVELSSQLLSSKFLKVVDLEGMQLEEIPKEIFNLFHLTHLNLNSTQVKIVPKSIKRLPNMEFLNLGNTVVRKLPKEILKLKKLRVLVICQQVDSSDLDFGRYGFEAPCEMGSLSELRALCWIDVAQNDKTRIVMEIGKMAELRKLRITNLKREDGMELCSSLEKLTNMRELEIASSVAENEVTVLDLNHPISPSSVQFVACLLLCGRLEKLPPWITSLQNLREIKLVWSGLRDDPLESLQHLPNLVEVGLSGAYEGESLWFKAGGFVKLEMLWLRKMKGLRWVRVEEGAMPNIKQLHLQGLASMEELPYGVEHLRQLQMLEIAEVSPPVLTSKLRMKEFKESEEYKRIAHIPQVIIFSEENGEWRKQQL